tara:strand:- start:1041 stop:1247 length:207 start_codon:yes stop_codon:yes gene_type:complete
MYDYQLNYWLNKIETNKTLFCDSKMNPNFLKWDPFQKKYFLSNREARTYLKPINDNDPRLINFLKKNA